MFTSDEQPVSDVARKLIVRKYTLVRNGYKGVDTSLRREGQRCHVRRDFGDCLPTKTAAISRSRHGQHSLGCGLVRTVEFGFRLQCIRDAFVGYLRL
jgi:hypothetical protein